MMRLNCWQEIVDNTMEVAGSFVHRLTEQQKPYSIESLHLPGHPMAAVVLRTSIKETHYSFHLL